MLDWRRGEKVEAPASVFSELKRRRVFRALIGYGLAAFAVLQIIEPIMHGLRWPEAVLSYVVAALAAGFPVIVALAWIFDVNAGRVERTSAPTRLKGARLALVLGGIGVLAATPGLTWYFLIRPRPQSAAVRASERSIAVLPFASLSAGDENKYFADAIHIELLGQLAKIGDLKVISRTSVLQYKEGARNLREIGEALNVSSVLEGSVQRSGNRVRIQAQLIDASRDRQIWADRYDRELTDLFLIQTAVAEEIAKALHARLLPEERKQIARQPTTNAEAYALYLRAWEILSRKKPAEEPIAELLFRRALELDPAFALAHARLSFLHSQAYWFNRDHTQARISQAREEADRALALQPDLAEAHLALGTLYYWGARDYDLALKEYEIARRSVPDVIEYIGYVQRRQGHFEDARRSQAQAVSLDPRNPRSQTDFMSTLIAMRRYDEAAATIERLATMSSDIAEPAKAYLAILRTGDVEPAKAVLRKLARASATTWIDTWVPAAALAELLNVVPQEALAALPAAPPLLAGSDYYRPKPLLIAMARDALEQGSQARSDYEAARVELEAAVEKDPGDATRRAALAHAYAGLDRKEDALREIRHALELVPPSKDALFGPVLLEELATIEARNGDAEAAIDLLGKLLAIPSRISTALLRIDPKWKPLRRNPRFQQLIGTHAF